MITGWLFLNKQLEKALADAARLRASHDRLLAAAKDVIGSDDDGEYDPDAWEALRAAIAAAEEKAP